MWRIAVLLFIFLPGPVTRASNEAGSKKDSLLQSIAISKEDSNKAKLLNSLSWQLKNTGDYRGCLRYANDALLLSRQLNYKKGEANAINNTALAHYSLGEYTRALDRSEEHTFELQSH